uniref:DUF397 domain-containing protein n=1 Tax=Amycolatopsis sp. CA-290885 TaxID=3239925 RepID=UPI003F4953E6
MTREEAAAALQAAGGWFKSSRSGGTGECVELTFAVPGFVGMRHSTKPGPLLTFTAAEFGEFLADAKNGHLDYLIG